MLLIYRLHWDLDQTRWDSGRQSVLRSDRLGYGEEDRDRRIRLNVDSCFLFFITVISTSAYANNSIMMVKHY